MVERSIYYRWDHRGPSLFETISEQIFFGKKVYDETRQEICRENSFENLCERAGFTVEDDYLSLEIYSKDEAFIFSFSSAGCWIAIRVEGMLNYICFIKEYVTPYLQFQKISRKEAS